MDGAVETALGVADDLQVSVGQSINVQEGTPPVDDTWLQPDLENEEITKRVHVHVCRRGGGQGCGDCEAAGAAGQVH